MIQNQNLGHLSLKDAGTLLRTKMVSPVELTRFFLHRIERLDTVIQSYITVLPDQAMADARRAEAEILRNEYKGPMHGIPFALKDFYNVKGVRTTAGSSVIRNPVPYEDATVVARLRAGGGILLGKNAMSEFGLVSDSEFGFPRPRNPWNLSYTVTGSSAGSSAAVAASLCMAALGTDTSGSIRVPAAHCGVVGLQPTYGRVSRHGVVPVSTTLDHCGSLTRTVEDAAVMLQAISGYDPKDLTSSPQAAFQDCPIDFQRGIEGMTFGVPRKQLDRLSDLLSPEVRSSFDDAEQVLISLGAIPRDITLPWAQDSVSASRTIATREAFLYHEPMLRSRGHQYGTKLRPKLIRGSEISEADYRTAIRERERYRKNMAEVFETLDVIVLPAARGLAPKYPQSIRHSKALAPAKATKNLARRLASEIRSRWLEPTQRPRPLPERVFYGMDPSADTVRFNVSTPFNLAGLPAISVPCGFTSRGLPMGLQIVGSHFDEPMIFRMALAYERCAAWFEHKPQLTI